MLRVGPTGTKRWLFRYRWQKQATRIAIGDFPDTGIVDARECALSHRRELKRGIDPRQSERASKKSRSRNRPSEPDVTPRDASHSAAERDVALCSEANDPLSIPKPKPEDKTSFHFLAYEYVEHYVKPSRDVPVEVIRILKKDALPYWTNRDARTITSREIIERLDAIVARGAPVMANRTADIFSQMFNFGVHRSIVLTSPVNLLFPPGGKEQSRDRVLSDLELQRFLHGLPTVCAHAGRRHTLMVLLLTLVRRGSLAQATWAEVDFQERVWRIPAAHDKERRAHIVPLTDWATSEFKALKELAGDSKYVLPKLRKNDGDQPSSAQLISRSVTRLRARFELIGVAPFTPHDLRRTGRTQMSMLGVLKEIGERVLNHSQGEIVETYDVYKYVPEKRAALEKWNGRLRTFIDTIPQNADFNVKRGTANEKNGLEWWKGALRTLDPRIMRSKGNPK